MDSDDITWQPPKILGDWHTLSTITIAHPESVEEVAYKLWENAGCPQCDGKEFWYKAEQILYPPFNLDYLYSDTCTIECTIRYDANCVTEN